MSTDFEKALLEEEARRVAEAQRDENDPVIQARIEARRREEFDKGVRLGWWDQDGEPINQASDDDFEEDE